LYRQPTGKSDKDRHPHPMQNIDCGIVIPIDRKTARRTPVHSLGKALWYLFATVATQDACIMAVLCLLNLNLDKCLNSPDFYVR